MDKVQTILYIIFVCVAIVAYIITTVLAIKRKRVKGESIDADEVLAGIASQVMGLVKAAEGAFSSVPKGGALKLKDVLNDTRALCEQAGVVFDKGFWTGFIAKAVELINIDRKPEEKAEETVAETATPTV